MARRKDVTSTRQLALKALDNMTGLTRSDAIASLQIMFPDAAEEYVKSLWAAHRTISKNNGSLVEVFSISEIKNGKAVEPYIKTEWVFNPTVYESLSVHVAKIRYKNDLATRLQIVQELL